MEFYKSKSNVIDEHQLDTLSVYSSGFCFFGVGYKLREKCSNTDVFLVRIFPHSD